MADRKYQLEVILENDVRISAGTFTVPQGDTGLTPTITANATVTNTVGTPSVEVIVSGTPENPILTFNFNNLKGERGVDGIVGKDGESITDLEVEPAGTSDEGNTYHVYFTVGDNPRQLAGDFLAPRGDKGDPGITYHLYRHNVKLSKSSPNLKCFITFYTTDPTPITTKVGIVENCATIDNQTYIVAAGAVVTSDQREHPVTSVNILTSPTYIMFVYYQVEQEVLYVQNPTIEDEVSQIF